MNFLILHFSIILLRWCKYFSLFLSICPEHLLDLMFLLKKLEFCMCVCVYVCLCARVYVYVCINATNQSNVIIDEMLTKFQKFVNWKFKKFVTYTWRKFFTCLKFCYISSSIKILYTLKQPQKHILIGIFFNPFMPRSDKMSQKLKQTCR